jgi:CBS domain-containing protein
VRHGKPGMTIVLAASSSAGGLTLMEHDYGCLPVVDDSHRLVGIVTERDFMRFATRTLQMHDPGGVIPIARSSSRRTLRGLRRAG